MRHAALAMLIAMEMILPTSLGAKPIALEYGGDLKQLCDAGRASGEYAMCYAFNMAVLETMENNTIYGMKACIPALVNVNRLSNCRRSGSLSIKAAISNRRRK